MKLADATRQANAPTVETIETIETLETIEAGIGRLTGALDALQRARRAALAGGRTARLLAIRADFEAGLPRAVLLGRHGCTRGQLAAWARRFGWRRPPPRLLVKMLHGGQRAAYRRCRRAGLTRAEALATMQPPVPAAREEERP